MRIKTKLLIETPLADLYNGTLNNFDTPRRELSGRVRVVKKVFLPAIENGMLEVRATTSSLATKYTTRIQFENVEFSDEDGQNVVSFKASDGQDYHIEPVGYNNDDVKVSCSCLDFYYRFSVWNYSDGSLLGDAPDPYIKKTDSEPQNPNEVPGLCKHLIALTDELRRENILR